MTLKVRRKSMNTRYLEQAEAFLSYIPLCLLVLWSAQVLINMITISPYGTYVISFVPSYASGSWTLGRHIRGFTLLSVAISYTTVSYLTSYLRPILRTVCSFLISFTGLIHYEFWWHVGLQYSAGVWPGQVLYWGVFTIALLLSLYYLNLYTNVLDMSPNRVRMLICFYGAFMLLWCMVMKYGFYQQFYLHKAGQMSDPTGALIMIDKIIGVIMWVTIIRRDKNELG